MKTSTKAGTAGAGAIMLACSFIPYWEGLDLTAVIDKIGTGHPVTYCNGLTDEYGKVKPGQKFTEAQCKDLLEKTIPKYWDGIAPCIHVDLPEKVKASLISGAFNAGTGAMCKSPMIAKMNAGDLAGGCDAFSGWYVRASGRVVKGLKNRREGERKLCLEGIVEPKPEPAKPSLWEQIKAFFLNLLERIQKWH